MQRSGWNYLWLPGCGSKRCFIPFCSFLSVPHQLAQFGLTTLPVAYWNSLLNQLKLWCSVLLILCMNSNSDVYHQKILYLQKSKNVAGMMLRYELTVTVMFKVVWQPGICLCISVINLQPSLHILHWIPWKHSSWRQYHVIVLWALVLEN